MQLAHLRCVVFVSFFEVGYIEALILVTPVILSRRIFGFAFMLWINYVIWKTLGL